MIHADLKCELDGKAVQIRDDGSRTIRCCFPDAATLLKMRSVAGQNTSLHRLGFFFDAIEHTLEVHVAGELVARFGRGAGGRFLTAVGIPAADLRLTKFFSLWIFRTSAG